MNPTWMLTMLVALSAAFAWSANRRWQLLKVGRGENRIDNLVERLKGTYKYAFAQKKMGYYPLAGLAHKLIFVGFLVLLLRSLIALGARLRSRRSTSGSSAPQPVHLPSSAPCRSAQVYEFAKDIVAALVILGALVFVYYRVSSTKRA